MSLTLTPITLSATIDTFSGADLYGDSDGLGLASQYLTYNVSIKTINAQNHADSSTREPLQYNGLDIQSGMFISDTGGGTILKIVSISDKGIGSLSCIVEDIDMMSYRLNSVNSMSPEESIVIFALNPEGEPVFAGSPFQVTALQKVLSRFSLNEKDDRVKFSHTLSTNLSNGDIVSVDTNGKLVKYGTANSSDTKLGIVVDVYKGGKDIFVKPFNDIIRNYPDSEKLTGNPGQIYYTDPSNLGDVTTTTGGKAVFMHLNTKIATTVEITSATNPSTGDTITINGVTVFDGPNGDSVVDTAAWAASLNTLTSSTNVSAAITQAPGQLNAEGNTMAYPGTIAGQDMVIFTNIQGQPPAAGSFAACTIDDGNNSATVTFDNPDATITYAPTTYEYLTPAAILAAFNTAITNGGLDITAALYSSPSHAGQAIELTTTGSATGITLANVQTDEFGVNIVGSGTTTGLSTSATLGASTLTLTRSSGGPIDIDGTPLSGGYINQSGVVSSNSGKVPYLLLIESEGGGGADIDGIWTNEDQDLNSTVTSGNSASTGITITHTPWSDGQVNIKINGVGVNLGDGVKTKDCYFSNDSGSTARLMADIEAGDELFWNSVIAGYALDATDDVDINYEASSDDIENYGTP